MSNITIGILLLVAGNFFASLSDVAVKTLQGDVQPFQYMFIRQLFSLVLITPLWLKQSRAQKKLQQKSITLIRAHLILIGSGCMVMAITYLPLATANAVFYTAPLLMLPLSVALLNEKPASGKVLATIIGFVGVLIVLRPSQFHWAALFALGTACTLALFNILVRKLPKEQTVITTLWWTTILSLPTSLILTVGYWQPISHTNIAFIALSAALILGYNGLAVLAYKKAYSSEIALAEYSGLIFVALFGALWFDEIPDWITLIGILLIVLPLAPLKRPKKKS
ncbi:DMT family transporter [Vibrio sp. 99-70-13A1]|uniref:DMT family transporter n=1 Tax=Vibrio sp. 99-70-13A1 TaxID=2607601 RepID=UPI0014934581|nr:DMT family transporter [Vibrio sp. 99-70-13A1]NOH97060.1 DMT family transporter [Vibrio sp. 99-70-13A1]